MHFTENKYSENNKRFIVLANGVINAAGHHLNNNLGLKYAFDSLGMETVFLAHRRADESVCQLLQAAPVMSYSPYERASKDPLCGDLESCYVAGNTLCEDLLKSVGKVNANDVLVITTTTQNELFACMRLLELLSLSDRPRLFLNFTLENFLSKETGEPSPLSSLYRFAARQIAKNSGPQRTLFSANSSAMVAVLQRIIGFPVRLLPIPKSYPSELYAEPAAVCNALPCVGVLGDMSAYKGFDLLPELIRLSPGVRWLIQEPRDGCEKYWGANSPFVRNNPGVTILKNGMPPDEYYRQFSRTDIILTPYDKHYKRLQTSGIFAEAVASGKVVIAPSTPWVLEHQQRDAWSGETFSEQTADDVSAALKRALARLPTLKENARKLAPDWRQSQSAKKHICDMLNYFAFYANGVTP